MESDKIKHKPNGDESLGLLVGNKIHRNHRCEENNPGGLRDHQSDEVLNDGRGEGYVGILPNVCRKNRYLSGRQEGKGSPGSGKSLSKGSEVCDNRMFQGSQVQ